MRMRIRPAVLLLFLPFVLILAVCLVRICGKNPVTPSAVLETPVPTSGQTATLPESTPVPESREDTPENSAAPVSETAPVEGSAFTLTILGETVPVAAGVTEEILSVCPGWLETSAAPGKEGFCVIYGHRNRNHLKVLKGIDFGDDITVSMPSGKKYVYTVESTEILDSESDLHIPAIPGKHLLLMTCYPFYYTGHAPNKFVCVCVLKDG